MKIDESVVQTVLYRYKEFTDGWRRPEMAEGICKLFSHHATFEEAVLTAREVIRRVELCGDHGLRMERAFGIGTQNITEGYDGVEADRLRESYLNENYAIKPHEFWDSYYKVVSYCSDMEFAKGIPYRRWQRKFEKIRSN